MVWFTEGFNINKDFQNARCGGYTTQSIQAKLWERPNEVCYRI